MKKEELSKYMSRLAKKRKNPYYGFKDPKVLAKALETRKKKHVSDLFQEEQVRGKEN